MLLKSSQVAVNLHDGQPLPLHEREQENKRKIQEENERKKTERKLKEN
jgi:hypothetical protein